MCTLIRPFAVVLLLGAVAFFAVRTQAQTTHMNIRLHVPKYYTPLDDAIYISGNFNTWSPNDHAAILTKLDDTTYNYPLELPTAGTPILFKFTRGAWTTVEANLDGSNSANRSAVYTPNTTLDQTVENWLDLGNATNRTATGHTVIMDMSWVMPQLNRTRRIWLYFPPDYVTNPTRRYSVVYIHDGQNVFDAATAFAGEWGVDEAMMAMPVSEQSIIVGIDNGSSTRINEYSPWVNTQYGGGQGAAYTNFLVQTLKPYIDATFRTQPDPEHTAIVGSSMGGLISYYAALQYPHVFGRVGVFSPSFWFSNQVLPFALLKTKQATQRWYFVCGQNESTTMASDMTAVHDTLRHLGFNDTSELKKVIRVDGQHSEWFWRREFPAAYRWLFRSSASVKVEEVRAFEKLKIWHDIPNETVYFNTPDTNYEWQLSIAAFDGRTVFDRTFDAGHFADTVSVSTVGWTRGSYVVTVRADKPARVMSKVVVVR